MVTRRWVDPVVPARTGSHGGLAYSLWRAPEPPWAGIVVLHGAGSAKESHHDFARAALPLGFAVLLFDARGHGASEGSLGAGALEDVRELAELLRRELPAGAPIGLRGSSMGGAIALLAAGLSEARAVVAIAPAPTQSLLRGARSGRFPARLDPDGLEQLLGSRTLDDAVADLAIPVLIQHAEGDEIVPVQGSVELARGLRHPDSRLVAVPGGHHRSVQHDEALQADALRFLRRALSDRGDDRPRR